jgi:hypothetical protein
MVKFLKEQRKEQRNFLKDIVNDKEFQSVVTSDNTDSNKRDKLQKIIRDKNIKTLDTIINSMIILKRRCQRKDD